MKHSLLVFLYLMLPAFAIGQEIYEINPDYPVHDLSNALLIYKDTDHNFTKEDILNDRKPVYIEGKQEPIFMEVGPTYWGKITLMATDKLKGWTLQFEDRKIGLPAWTKGNGKVDVYGYEGNSLIFHKKTGVEYDKDKRDIQAHWVLNQVSLEELPINSPVTLVIKATGNQIGYAPYFLLSARSPNHVYYHQVYQFQNSFNLFMLGVTFIIFLYHLLQYVYLREPVFFWFSLWLFFCTVTQAMSVGLFIIDLPVLRFEIWAIIANGIFYSFWFFGRSFIESKRKYPLLDKVMKGLALFLLAEIIIVVLSVALFNVKTLRTGVGIHYLIIHIYTIASFIVSLILITKNDLFARYFGIGSLIGSSFLIIGSLWSLEVIKPIRYFDPYATAIFLQIIIYSFGISYRRQVLNKQNEAERIAAQKNISEMQRIKEMDDIKTRFFANISHEFRTPLSLISGPLSLAKKSTSPDRAISISESTYQVIIKNTNRLQNLIDQLLDLSKIESGKINLNLVDDDLIQFIKSITYSFESLAERKNISLNTSFPAELIHAYFDKDKLEKILSNLLSNAFKFTPDNGTITVTVDHDDNYYIIEISDTGKGIPREELKRIFERFYRVESTEEKGSGIGLALTKELVDLHNGQISVDSRKHVGTTFKVRLPYTLSHLPADLSLIQPSLNSKVVETTTLESIAVKADNGNEAAKKSHDDSQSVVLVVEDNEDLRNYIHEILNGRFRVLTADNGLKGERMAFEHIPDIIISDVMMPKKDGYALCHDLKTNAKTSHIPIVMLTAKAGHDNKMEGLTQGADVYLTKPFNADELLLRIKNLLVSRNKLWEHFKTMDFAMVTDMEVSSLDDTFLKQVAKSIKDNLDNELFSVEDLAADVGFSRAQLHRKLKALINKSANQLIIEMRLNEAKFMLENNTGSVSEVAYSVGYSNLSYFTKSFKEKFGVLPSMV